MLFALCSLLFALCSLLFALCSLLFLLFALCSLLFALCSLLFALCSLLFALCSLLLRCSLFFVLCSLFFVLCSLFFVLCSLFFVFCFFRCTPHLTCVSLLSNGSLAAHQVQTQSAQQFARYGKRMCTCARANATHPDLCKAREEGVFDTLSSARATCRGRHRWVSAPVKYEIY